MQENKLWQEEEERKAALEEDVTKKEDLGSFYVNLLTRNEAYGGGRRVPLSNVGSTGDKHSPSKNEPEDTAGQVNSDKKEREERGNIGVNINCQISSKDTLTERGDVKEGDFSRKRIREVSPIKLDPTVTSHGTEPPPDATRLARRKNDDTTVSAARERYLKRKAQQQM